MCRNNVRFVSTIMKSEQSGFRIFIWTSSFRVHCSSLFFPCSFLVCLSFVVSACCRTIFNSVIQVIRSYCLLVLYPSPISLSPTLCSVYLIFWIYEGHDLVIISIDLIFMIRGIHNQQKTLQSWWLSIKASYQRFEIRSWWREDPFIKKKTKARVKQQPTKSTREELHPYPKQFSLLKLNLFRFI